MSRPELPLIEGFEIFVDHVYDDGYGFLTCAWGHKVRPGETFPAVISRELGNQILERDLTAADLAVDRLCPVPLNDNQRGALRSFAFNAGAGTLQRATFRQALLRGDYEDVPAGMLKYIYSKHQKSRGLLRRRQAEAALFVA